MDGRDLSNCPDWTKDTKVRVNYLTQAVPNQATERECPMCHNVTMDPKTKRRICEIKKRVRVGLGSAKEDPGVDLYGCSIM